MGSKGCIFLRSFIQMRAQNILAAWGKATSKQPKICPGDLNLKGIYAFSCVYQDGLDLLLSSFIENIPDFFLADLFRELNMSYMKKQNTFVTALSDFLILCLYSAA